MPPKAARINILNALSVELVNQVLTSLARAELRRMSQVSKRLRTIVCQYRMPCTLRQKTLDNEKACNVWLAHVKSILDLDSRVALVFEICGSPYRHINFRRLSNWYHLLCALGELISSTYDDGRGRITALVAMLPRVYAEELLFSVLPRRVPHLRELELGIHGPWEASLSPSYYHRNVDDSRFAIDSDVFRDGAPALRSVNLQHVVLPVAGVPSFAAITSFHCDAVSLADLQRQISMMPQLRSLSMETLIMPSDIPDLNTWRASQPLLPGGITNLTFHDLLINSVTLAQAFAYVMNTATAKARDVTVQATICCIHRDTPGVVVAFTVGTLPTNDPISVAIEQPYLDGEEEEEETDDEYEFDDGNLPLRLIVAGAAPMCDGSGTRTVAVDITWETFIPQRELVQGFFERLPDSGLSLAGLKIALSDLKLVAPLQLLSQMTRSLGRLRLEVQEKKNRRKEDAVFGVCGDFDMSWSWVPQKHVDVEEPPPAHTIRCSTPPGIVGEPLQVDIQFTAAKGGTLVVQTIVVDTILEASGFSRACPAKIELGAGLVMQQKIMRWDSGGKAFRYVNSRFSE